MVISTIKPGASSEGLTVNPVRIDGGRHKYADKLDRAFGFMPNYPRNYISEVLLAGSFIGAIQQSFQQILIDLIPKSVIGGSIRALPNPNNPAINSEDYLDQAKPTLGHIIQKLLGGHYLFNSMVAIDEAIVELLEYLGVYFLPTIFAAGFAGRALGKITGVDFEFFGHPTHNYIDNFGKEVSVGAVKEKRLKIDKKILSKIALGKTMLYAMTTLFCSCVAFMIPSIRAFIVDKVLGISDYSKLLGYKQKLSKDKDFNPLDNAAKIIKNCLIIALSSIPFFLGATWFLNKRIEKPGLHKFFKRASMHLDLDKNFGLSRIFVAPTIMTAAVGYIMGSRDSAERIETFNRAFLWAAPAVIFYKQVITSIIASLTSMAFGVGGVSKIFPMISKKIKKGERDILDWNFLKDFRYDQKTHEYDGLITKLKDFNKLKGEKKLRYLRTMKFINWWAPYLFALFVGAAVNLHNFKKIWELHQNDKKGDDSNSSGKNQPVLVGA